VTASQFTDVTVLQGTASAVPLRISKSFGFSRWRFDRGFSKTNMMFVAVCFPMASG